MRIRFTLEITRTPKPDQDPGPEPPVIVDGNYANTERAEPAQPGFSIDMPDHG